VKHFHNEWLVIWGLWLEKDCLKVEKKEKTFGFYFDFDNDCKVDGG
jgi:hypothetical protein